MIEFLRENKWRKVSQLGDYERRGHGYNINRQEFYGKDEIIAVWLVDTPEKLAIEFNKRTMRTGVKVKFGEQKGIFKCYADNNDCFVVFNCYNDWRNYEDYTAQRCELSALKLGW